MRSPITDTDVFAVYPKTNLKTRPLSAENVARSAVYLLGQPLEISIKALDVVPTGECVVRQRL